MVITVSCPSCSTSFPVDPNKIPEGGVNGRCTQCGDIFRIEKPEAAPAEPAVALEDPAPVAEAPAEAAPSDDFAAAPAFEEPVAPPEPEPEPAFDEPLPEPVAAEPEPAPEPEPVPEPAAPEPEPAAEEPAVTGFQFGKRDPTDKAKRLARVLVSDMIMYNAERHQSALEEGTLKADFEEEIEKSWAEFVEQVGDEIANGPGKEFWTAALNDILAKGEQVF